MNRTNIQATIDILKQAQNFSIFQFQNPKSGQLANTIEELHRCGNTACIAGYVALSQAWRDFGGYIHDGTPSLSANEEDHQALKSMMAFWGLPKHVTSAIIFGDGWNDFLDNHGIVGLPFDDDDEPEELTGWYTLTKDDAISLFEQLLAKG